MNAPYSIGMDSASDLADAPPALIESLIASKAEIDRGERVSMEAVLADGRAALARIESRRSVAHPPDK